jgi:hypothetical protein
MQLKLPCLPDFQNSTISPWKALCMDHSALPIPEGYSISQRLPQDEIDRLSEIVRSAPFVRKVLDSMPELVAVMTPTRQIVMANQAMLVFLEMEEGAFRPGPRPGELLWCVNRQVSPHGCGNSKYCSQCGAFHTILASIASNQRETGECLLTYEREGEADSLELLIWCEPFEVEGYQFSLLAAVDVSDQKRREALERVFFHDILNTIAALKGKMDLMGMDPSTDLGRLIEPLQNITNILVDEVKSQRDLTLAEKGVLNARLRYVDSDWIIETVLFSYGLRMNSEESLRKDTQSQNIRFATDPSLLTRVLGNMVKNALEASKPGETVTIGCREQDGEIEFRVHNEQYMAEPVQLKIFQRSFSTKGYGRGLGTYSMRLLGERCLGGTISFDSQPDKGTTFYARFPINQKCVI